MILPMELDEIHDYDLSRDGLSDGLADDHTHERRRRHDCGCRVANASE
jgi:hypothetical protein